MADDTATLYPSEISDRTRFQAPPPGRESFVSLPNGSYVNWWRPPRGSTCVAMSPFSSYVNEYASPPGSVIARR